MKKQSFWLLVCSLICVCLFAAYRIEIRGKKEEAAAEIRVLLSTDGDPMRKRAAEQAFYAAAEQIPGVTLELSFVESDTLAFLKLLYADKAAPYDIVGLGAASILSACDQGLIRTLEPELMRDDGLFWLNQTPAVYMEHAAIYGSLYALPAQRSRLMLYVRPGEAGSLGKKPGNEKPVAVPAQRIIMDKLMTGSRSEYEEQAERRIQSEEDDALALAEDYLIDTTENREFLTKLREGRESGGLVFYESCEEAVRAFLRGELLGLVMDEAYEPLVLQESGSEVEKQPLLQEDGSPWPLQGYDLCLTSSGSLQNRRMAWQLIRQVAHAALAETEAGAADGTMDREALLSVEETETLNAENDAEQDSSICFTSAYQTRARLWTDRMISEFLYRGQDPETLLSELQKQINSAEKEKG